MTRRAGNVSEVPHQRELTRDGVHFVSPNVTVNFAQAMPAEGAYAAGELKPTESVVVYFNVTVI